MDTKKETDLDLNDTANPDGFETDDMAAVSGKRKILPAYSFIDAIKPRIEDGDDASPGSYRLLTGQVDILGAPVASGRRDVAKAISKATAKTVPPLSGKGPAFPGVVPGKIPAGKNPPARISDKPQQQPIYVSCYEQDFNNLRDLTMDRIGFIREFRVYREAHQAFLNELIKWLAGRPLTLHMSSVPAEHCRGWKLAGDPTQLLQGVCPRIRICKGEMTFEVDLSDILRGTK